VPPDVFVHLSEPAAWRTALTEGAVRPPSLSEVGFVHLSTPEQVHLPAERLYPGRRDLVLLVVDPARLTDPVRFEDGVPADPGGMLFPHLYGPLPVAAVTSVVPYRPPSAFVLPAPGDRLGRALSFHTSLQIRRAVGVGDVPGGVAVLDPDFPASRDNNRLVITEPVDALTVERATDDVAANAGWPHRSVALTWPGAAEVAGELGARGWTPQEFVLMARTAAPAPAPARVEVVDQVEVHPFWERSWRSVLPQTGRDLDRLVSQLIGREHLNDQMVAVLDLVVREAGGVVAAGQLRVDGATAAVDSVQTDPEHRGRGHADAILTRAVDLAAAAGCDLVVLEAAADDWPRRWYGRRGFEVVGSVWEVLRSA
jgi:uncharacterized protein (DUF952 family)/GNAT superfamily N-acetyltransferase